MASDIQFDNDNSTITVTAGEMRFIGVDGTGGALITRARIDLGGGGSHSAATGTVLGNRQAAPNAADVYGFKRDISLFAAPLGPPTPGVFDSLSNSKSIVDLTIELRLLHHAVLSLNARLKALGG